VYRSLRLVSPAVVVAVVTLVRCRCSSGSVRRGGGTAQAIDAWGPHTHTVAVQLLIVQRGHRAAHLSPSTPYALAPQDCSASLACSAEGMREA